MNLFPWFVERAETNSGKPFLHFHEKKTLTYGDFLSLIMKAATRSSPVVEVFSLEYTLESLLRFFTCMRDGRRAVLCSPTTTGKINEAEMRLAVLGEISIFSSGTGGVQKLWPHSMDTLGWNFEEICATGVGSDNCAWSAFPPYSISGLKSLLVAIHAGGSVIWEPFPTGINFVRFPLLLRDLPCNSLSFPPVVADALVWLCLRETFTFPSRIDRVLSGGDLVSAELMGRFERAFHRKMAVLYGMTETAGPIFYQSAEDWCPLGLGRLLKGTYRVEDGGRLAVTGGFLSPAIDSKWFRTNDFVTETEGGIRFFSRENEWIWWGGKKVSLVEIENELTVSLELRDCWVIKKDDRLFAKIVLSRGAPEKPITWPLHLPWPEIQPVKKIERLANGKRGRLLL